MEWVTYLFPYLKLVKKRTKKNGEYFGKAIKFVLISANWILLWHLLGFECYIYHN